MLEDRDEPRVTAAAESCPVKQSNTGCMFAGDADIAGPPAKITWDEEQHKHELL
jgi:hypothetical protein